MSLGVTGGLPVLLGVSGRYWMSPGITGCLWPVFPFATRRVFPILQIYEGLLFFYEN